MAHRYVITIGAHLDEHWSEWFDGLTITNGVDGQSTLAGVVADQAALHGLLGKLRDLGVPLLALQPLPHEADNSTANDPSATPPDPIR